MSQTPPERGDTVGGGEVSRVTLSAEPRLVQVMDRVSAAVGAVVGWLVVLMIAVGAFNAVARYFGRFVGWNLSSNAYLELQWYLFSCAFLLGGCYALSRGAHVRVDVIYARLSRRAQCWIDLAGGVFFLMPFALAAIWLAVPSVRHAWQNWEMSPDPGGLPRYPIKTVVPIGFALLALQGLAEIARAWSRLRSAQPEAGQ